MSIMPFIMLFAAVSGLCPLTAGWENRNPERRMPQPAAELWRAPFRQGESAFNVEWRQGAKGRVIFGEGEIRIEKANDTGMEEYN